MRVLEIGTGTGCNAAVLARLVGAENVASAELDPVAVSRAREALASLGLPVEVTVTPERQHIWLDSPANPTG